ncbi:hypothetical protein CLF_101306 [Clonorchis sinensis]|uniref:DUF4817 domain-containing protein n=1 Tax=Clonorchis sinensis TaxID=79923 RepID=G7Y5G6_CLOSI|nr:hypothetical protein CLF_101306 [Clonorchis sinensis]
MNVSKRIEIVKLYDPLGESATAARRGYKTKHGLIGDPFTVSTITRLIAKFESTGSVVDFPGRWRKSLSDERAPIVQNAVEQLQSQSTMTSSSITQVSQLTGVPRASVHRIMRRRLHRYPYHFTLLKNITEEDQEQRVTFANWLLDNEEIVFRRELQTNVIPQLKQHKKSSTIFQQDGAPPHYSNQVKTYPREQFSDERAIALGFPNFCPARFFGESCRRMLSRNSSSTRSHRPSFNKMALHPTTQTK